MTYHRQFTPLNILFLALTFSTTTLAAVLPYEAHSKPHKALSATTTTVDPSPTPSNETDSNRGPNGAHIGIGIGVAVTVLVLACIAGLFYRRNLARNANSDKAKVDITQVNAFLDEVRASKVPLTAVTPSPSPPSPSRTPPGQQTYVREYTGHSAARGVSVYSYAPYDAQSDKGSIYSRDTYEAYRPGCERAMTGTLGSVREDKTNQVAEEQRPLVSENVEIGSHRA